MDNDRNIIVSVKKEIPSREIVDFFAEIAGVDSQDYVAASDWQRQAFLSYSNNETYTITSSKPLETIKKGVIETKDNMVMVSIPYYDITFDVQDDRLSFY